MITEFKKLNCIGCGGTLEPVGGKLVCPYCHNVYEEVEQISEEEAISLNRATTDRNLFRFDEALEEYNLLISRYPNNEMAYWGAFLCDYGIVYEQDYNGKSVPTCHRLSERPVTKSPYYSHLSKEHLKDATEIETLRASICAKSKTISPYDVFICYKATDDFHGRAMPTKESVWARDVYELLTHELKLKVFFAEKSLQGSNAEYEPHIYAALNSAKIMFVMADSLDHVNAVWVKNEWKRYSKYAQEGQNKTIRVIYDNIEPYDLPRELQKTQAINHNSMSWVNAVKSAVNDIFAKPTTPTPAPKPKTSTPKMDAKSAFDAGCLHYFGQKGNPVDYAKAVPYFQIAASQGHTGARYNLGLCYAKGQGVPQDYAEAIKYYRLAANQGHALAQNNLGVCYHNGTGVTKNLTEAKKWYKLSADQGNQTALANLQKIENAQKSTMKPEEAFNLGYAYYNGTNGKTRDYAKAVQYYTMAANQGHAVAQNNLGVCYKTGNGVAKNEAEAVKWYRLAANQGNKFAQDNLGWCYQYGVGTPKNTVEAVKYYRLSANQGHASAQANLGYCLANGIGTAKNNNEAVKWYTLAANQGNAMAQNNLGWCYENGYGTPINKPEAFRLYQLAANQGHANGQANLGYCYYYGIGTLSNYNEAARWYNLAANQGNVDAINNLGLCYEKGHGVPRNINEAVRLYRLAASKGNQVAKDNLKKLGYY